MKTRLIGIIVLVLSSSEIGAQIASQNPIDLCQIPLKEQLAKLDKSGPVSGKEVEKSRLNFYIGRCALSEKNTELAIPFFEKGLEEAEAAMANKSDDWPAVFW